MRKYTTIQHRRGEASEWTAANPVLAAGEMGIETGGALVRHKMGDGVSAWSDLPYAEAGPGAAGASAYDLAVAGGFVGTEPEWVASLKGKPGDKGDTGSVALTGASTTITVGPTSLNVGGRDAFVIHTDGNLNGVDLNTLYGPSSAGPWEVFKWGGGPINLPVDFTERGILEVYSNTTNAAHQRIVARADGRTWVRACQDQNVTPAKWSDWRPDRSKGVAESARTNLAIAGDSLAASHNLVESLNSELPAVNVYSRAWNGETSDGIALRLGAKSPVWEISGGVIPGATTPVTLTTKESLEILSTSTYFTGKLAGVPGRITKSGAQYAFVRDTAGSSVTIPRDRLNPDWAKATARHMLGIIMGRNDVSMGAKGVEGGVVEHVIANTIRIVDWLDAENRLFFLMGTINRTTEPRGSAGYEMVTAINKAITVRYPGQTVLVREYLVNQAIHDLGITPTQDDLDNIANDCPPPSVMVDITHYTDEAAAAISANVLKPWIEGSGLA